MEYKGVQGVRVIQKRKGSTGESREYRGVQGSTGEYSEVQLSTGEYREGSTGE